MMGGSLWIYHMIVVAILHGLWADKGNLNASHLGVEAGGDLAPDDLCVIPAKPL